MSEMQELEKELREYLEKEPNLNRGDRFSYLMAIFQKHMEFNKLSHVINYKDYFNILAQAKSNYVKLTLPASLSNKELDPNDSRHLAMIEALLGYLSLHNLLRKQINVDYTTRVK